MTPTLLSTAQAAEELGISRRGVQKLIEYGTLPAMRVGRDYLITLEDVQRAKKRPRAGIGGPVRNT
jgi:excisionase family DNA binding protein